MDAAIYESDLQFSTLMENRGVSGRRYVCAFAVLHCFTIAPVVAADWPQFDFDPAHSGVNPAETLVSSSNVSTLRLLYSIALPAVAPGAPVFLSAVSTSGGIKDLLFVVTTDGSLFALDASDGSRIWAQRPATTPQSKTASSPVIDPNRQYVYSYALDGKVHKYQVADGGEVIGGGWPQVATLKPDVEGGSSALATATAGDGQSYLYVVQSGLARDAGDFQGHVTAIDLSIGTQIVFNVVCSDQGNIHFVENGNVMPPMQNDCLQETIAPGDPNAGNPTGDGGIWGRPGVVYDAIADRIYLATGNGNYDANFGGHNWSDSVLALPAALSSPMTSPLDSFTPGNYAQLMYNDLDLGSTTGGALYTINVPQTQEVKTQPISWTNPADGSILVIVANDFGIAALKVVVDGSNSPKLASTGGWTHTGAANFHGTSAGGSSPIIANGVLYYAGESGVTALDPATGNILWNDTSIGVGTPTSQSSIHRQSPIVVNGKLYITDQNAKLWVYGADEIFGNGFE